MTGTPRYKRRLTCWLLLLSAGCLLPAPSEGGDRLVDERTVEPFICHADFPLGRYEILLVELARLRDDVTEILELSEPDDPIHLFLFARKSTYDRCLRRYFPRIPPRRAMFVRHRQHRLMFAYLNRELAIDVRHEGTHAMLHTSLPVVPLWLDEGLAEYFEAPRRLREFDHPYLEAVRTRAIYGVVPRLETLEALADIEQMRDPQYRDAWAWVHFMLHGSEAARRELLDYLADLESQTDPGRLSSRLRRRLPDLERRFVEHFRNWKQ